MKFLICGLGNIGGEYDATRHNIGFDIADAFTIAHGGSFSSGRYAMRAICKWKGKTFIVIKPSTFMNLSGSALKYWMDQDKIPLEQTLVVADDLALPLGTLRLRASGSAGGHNGLRHIEQVLGTSVYPRLRVGIGSDFPKGAQVNFVLGRWESAQLPAVHAGVLRAVGAVESWAFEGIGRAMTIFNK